jgi:hypothetical protein
LRQVIDRQAERGTQALDQMRFLEEQCVIRREKHQLPAQAGNVVRKPERNPCATAAELRHCGRGQSGVDVDHDPTVSLSRTVDNPALCALIEERQSLTGQRGHALAPAAGWMKAGGTKLGDGVAVAA